MFFTTWSKRSSKVLFAAAMTGLLWLWPAEAKPAGQPKPTPTLYTVNLIGDVTGLGENFKYSFYQSKKTGRTVESLGDAPPVPLTFYGDIAEKVYPLVGGEGSADSFSRSGTLVLQVITEPPASPKVMFFFCWNEDGTGYTYDLVIEWGVPTAGSLKTDSTIEFDNDRRLVSFDLDRTGSGGGESLIEFDPNGFTHTATFTVMTSKQSP